MEPATEGSLRRRLPSTPTIFAALLCLSSMMYAYKAYGPAPKIDLYLPWAVVHAVREHVVPTIYSEDARRALGNAAAERAAQLEPSSVERSAILTNLRIYEGRIETVSTPALYALMSVFVSDDYDVDRGTFMMAQIAAVSGACVLFAVAIDLAPWVGLLLAGWGVWFFVPALADFREGNVSSFELLCLGVVAVASRTPESPARDALVAGMLGFAAAVKPNMLPIAGMVILPLAVDGRVRPLIRAASAAGGGALVCVLGSSAWFGTPSVWAEWARSLPRIAASEVSLREENVGLATALREATHRDLSRPLLALVVAVCVVVLLRSKRTGAERSRDEVLLAIAVGGAATAIFSPIFWVHYGVLLVPAAFACWRFAPPWTATMTTLAILLLSTIPRMLNDDKLFASGILLAQVVLFALALVAWSRDRRGVRSARNLS